MCSCFFLFKQKTAYDLRISDWSSDVCSSDLAIKPLEPLYTSMFKPVLAFFLLEMGLIASGQLGSLKRYGFKLAAFALLMPLIGALIGALQIGRATCRDRVCQYG